MKGPKRDTRKEAAGAAGRSAEAPHSSKSKSKRPAAPSKPSTVAALKDLVETLEHQLAVALADARRWRALAEKLRGEIEARNKAALAGVAVTLNAAAIAKVIEEVYHPCFAEVLAVSRDIALNPVAEDKDRLKAVGMIKDQVAGPVAQKLKLGADEGVAITFVSGLPPRDPAPAEPEPTTDSEQSEGSSA